MTKILNECKSAFPSRTCWHLSVFYIFDLNHYICLNSTLKCDKTEKKDDQLLGVAFVETEADFHYSII